MNSRSLSRLLILPLSTAFACAQEQAIETGTTTAGACPAGACGATPRLDLSRVNFSGLPFPTTMDPGEKLPVRAVMQNTGPNPWTHGPTTNRIRLFSTHEPRSFWGEPYEDMATTVPVNGTEPFDLLLVAPFTPGTYNFEYRMRDSTIPGGFGTNFQTTITVQEQQRAYECQLVSETAPDRIGVGRAALSTFTVRNIGTATWLPTTFRLCENDNHNFGAVNCVNVTSPVAPGATFTFSWNLLGPATPGIYPLVREITDARVDGVGRFNDTPNLACIQLDIEATLCGDNVPFNDPTEECDDGNTLNGDGCSETCVIENPRIVDLSNTTADRAIFGRTANKALGNVVYGDVVLGDTLLDVCVGETDNVFIPNTTPQRSRNVAGRVSCYDGNNFFGGSDFVTPNGSAFNIIGATAGDHVGGSSSGRIVIGDVTNDGSPDLILSAPFADGPGETRTDAGEVYVISNTEVLTGTIDLANPAPAIVTTIYGAAAGDNLRILAFGDMDGDFFRDLIIGAAMNDSAGQDAGVIYVVSGATLLGGTIDLASTMPLATILGPSPGEMTGFVAAVGQVAGSAFRDLVFSAPSMSFGGRAGTGVTWVLTGPLAGGIYDLTTQYDLRIVGGQVEQRSGSTIAIGNVRGPDTQPDLVLGHPGAINSAGVRVGRVDVFQGPIAIPPSRTIDLSVDSANTQIWGEDRDDRAGSSLALGHWNSDNRLDIAISASSADGPGNTRDGAGELILVLGHENMASQVFLSRPTPLRVYGANTRDLMGAHVLNVAFTGDLDANQSSRSHDVCVGSYHGFTVREGRVDCFSAP